MRRTAWPLALLTALLAFACGDGPTLPIDAATDLAAAFDAGVDAAADSGPAPRPLPRDPVPCRLALPLDAEDGRDVHCLDVPGDDGGDIAVHVTVFDAALPALPVYVLMGGPALRGSAYVRYLTQETRRARFGERPVVFIEQRGVGVSVPALRCASGDDLGACATQLRDEGVDLARFTTRHAADDVATVADRLAHSSFTLAGGSYGSRLGLEVLRRHGARVERAYLESIVPPDTDFLLPLIEGSEEALEALCAGEACPPDVLARAAERARTMPPSGVFGPIGEALLGFAVFEALYHQDLAAALPATLEAFATGAPEGLAGVEAALSRPPRVEPLAYRAVICADFLPLFDGEAYAAAAALGPPELAALFTSIGATFGSCEALSLAAGPAASRAPVVSDVPTLLVAPGLDARSPLSGALRVAETLPRARVLRLPGRVHTPALGYQVEGRALDECAASVMRTFLADPNADDPACAATSP
ncbi:MAG: alpha/beta hydrolase [Myxococcota bacterium]